MAGPRQSVGGKARIYAPPSSSPVIPTDLVTVFGEGLDPAVPGNPTGTTVGTMSGQRDAVDPLLPNANFVAAASALYALNSSSKFDRNRIADAALLASFLGNFGLLVNNPGEWSITHAPAAATKATISKAAVAGMRHVCTSIGARLIIPDGVNQPIIQLNLRDDATGAGTILWSQSFGFGAASINGKTEDIFVSGLNIVGTAGKAMTLEFSAAGAATTVESVALTGYDMTA